MSIPEKRTALQSARPCRPPHRPGTGISGQSLRETPACRGTPYSAVTRIEKWIPIAFIFLHIMLFLLPFLVQRDFLI